MHRRDFLTGVSTISVMNPHKENANPSIRDAVAILEKAVRREIADVQEIRVSFEPDKRKNIAMIFAVVRIAIKQTG